MFCVGCRAGVLKYQHPLMEKYNIKYLADGGNLSEGAFHKLGFLGVEQTNDVSIFIRTKYNIAESSRDDTKLKLLSAILKEILRNPYFLNPSLLIESMKEYREISRKTPKDMTIFKPLIYEKYDEDKVIILTLQLSTTLLNLRILSLRRYITRLICGIITSSPKKPCRKPLLN